MAYAFSTTVDEICNRGAVKDGDVHRLRQVIYGKAGIESAEIEALFHIDDHTHIQDPAWPAFFVEAVTDFIVGELQPQGYVTNANAAWLMQRVGRNGRIESATELELLLNILEKARWTPESLVRFTLEQVKHAVIDGSGPLRAGKRLGKGQITAGEVDLLRRVLYAFGGDGNAAITRCEAEVLFEIEQATAGAMQPPEWQELFVKAIASVMMTSSGYKVPSREEALRREDWVANRGDLSVGNFLGRVFAAYEKQSSEEHALARLERQRVEIITNEEVTESDAGWLAGRIGRDQKFTANELMLIAFLKRESPRIHPALQNLVERMARAA